MPAAVMISKSHKAVTLYIGDKITALTEVNFQRQCKDFLNCKILKIILFLFIHRH